MKNLILLLAAAMALGCSTNTEGDASPLEAATFLNVSYGADVKQKMDLYLPAGRNKNDTKVIVLVHGGGWSAGSKEDFNTAVPIIRQQFPDHAVVNVGYRLATVESPAYPKQIDDLASAIEHLETNGYSVSKHYGFVGSSAGAHLSMLYGYMQGNTRVKAICNLVGPTDFTDPAYEDSMMDLAFPYLVGENPTAALIEEVSPVFHVTAQSPKTIQFLGNQDSLIPVSQGQRLKAKLDASNVENELHYYDAGHGDFSQADYLDLFFKLEAFFSAHL